MADDIKATRLSKAAREFNVGISTIVEFLHKKGFELDPNPNTKLPHEAYLLLVKEYSTDISVKKESEKLILKDLHRKKESLSIDDFSEKGQGEEPESDKEVLVKDSSGAKKSVDIVTEIKKPDIKLVGKIDLEKTSKPKNAATKPESDVKTLKKGVPAEEKKQLTEEEKAASAAEKTDKKGKTSPKKSALEETSGETKHAKGISEKEAREEEALLTKNLKEEPAGDMVELPDEIEIEEETEDLPEEVQVFRTGIQKLTGPTVVGKIDLPVEEKKKSTPYQPVKINGDSDFRRKKRRKRITKEADQVSVVKPDQSDKKEKMGKKPIRKRPVRVEVDEEEVQKQIKETLARLTTKGKSKGSRYRREKRDAVSQKNREVEDKIEQEKNILKVTEFVSANELAIMMNIPVTEIISTCMNLGLFVSINQRLDAETMALLADEFGFKVEFVSAELQEAVREAE
ncbi:MAG: translation initiation factor IF-2 N-terminal domain-containing protein, partial [Bacteroidales bacterium]